MNRFEYKCIYGPGIADMFSKGFKEQAIKSFNEILNEHAQDGWEFDKISTIPIQPRSVFHILIFKKAI